MNKTKRIQLFINHKQIKEQQAKNIWGRTKMKDIDQTLKQAVELGIKEKFIGTNTTVTVKGIEYYAMFRFRPMPKKCSKCGQDIKEF